jgi:hypothetical protein
VFVAICSATHCIVHETDQPANRGRLMLIDRNVDVYDLLGLRKYPVGNSLLHANVCHTITEDASEAGGVLRHAVSISSRSSLTRTLVEAASRTASA